MRVQNFIVNIKVIWVDELWNFKYASRDGVDELYNTV